MYFELERELFDEYGDDWCLGREPLVMALENAAHLGLGNEVFQPMLALCLEEVN
jgi:hypothetical protein